MTEKDVVKETRPRMEHAIEDVRRKLATVRTGRASISLLDTVTVDYTGAVAATGVVFQSSIDSGQPVSFPLGNVIKGWQDGIPGMKAGGSGVYLSRLMMLTALIRQLAQAFQLTPIWCLMCNSSR